MCGFPTPSGPCRRPVTPGRSCGVDHFAAGGPPVLMQDGGFVGEMPPDPFLDPSAVMPSGVPDAGHLVARFDEEPGFGAVAEAFESAGVDLFVVGGAVRDRLRGVQYGDIDLTTPATPDVVRRVVGRLGKVFDTGAEYGTIGVAVDGNVFEITTFRSEVYTNGDRRPDVSWHGDLEGDLSRRDFTVNAVAANASTGEIIDPQGGVADLWAGVLRSCGGDPARRFAEDPLRVARLWRHAVMLDVHVDSHPDTFAAARGEIDGLERMARERRTSEVRKALSSDDPAALDVAAHASGRLGADRALFGDLDVAALRQPWVDAGDTSPSARLATLAYATGPDLAAADRALRDLKFSRWEREFAVTSAVAAVDAENAASPAQVRSIARRFGDDHLDAARSIAVSFRKDWPAAALFGSQDVLAQGRRRMPVDGADAIGIGLTGPGIGRALADVEQQLLEDPALDRDEAIQILRGHVDTPS